jgi:hypothetical protein
LSIASNVGSGVVTVMTESRSVQRATFSSIALRARLRSWYSATSCEAWTSVAAAPSTMAISRLSPGSSSMLHWSAAQGSIPEPVIPERMPLSSRPAGSDTERFRPMKSRRPAVYPVTGSLMQ